MKFAFSDINYCPNIDATIETQYMVVLNDLYIIVGKKFVILHIYYRILSSSNGQTNPYPNIRKFF